jgi:hypothetical protein
MSLDFDIVLCVFGLLPAYSATTRRVQSIDMARIAERFDAVTCAYSDLCDNLVMWRAVLLSQALRF